jgi:hypothetical protein
LKVDETGNSPQACHDANSLFYQLTDPRPYQPATPEREDAMTLEFNEKGKYYTDIISKTAIAVIIQTTTHRIEGLVHVRLDGRLKNELDLIEPFLAVTEAKVYGSDGSLLYESDFLTVSRLQIVWIIQSDSTANPGEKR